MRCGIILIGTGDWAPIAAIAALAAKQQNPDVTVRVLTTQAYGLPGIEEICVSGNSGPVYLSRNLKTSLELYTADWEQSLYLDADVMCLQPVPALFKYKLALVPEPLPAVEHCLHIKGAEYDYTIRHYKGAAFFNGGVFAWQREIGKKFFRQWHQEWKRFGGLDQLALARALRDLGNQAPITELPWHYNHPIHSYTEDVINSGHVRLLHVHTSHVSLASWLKIAQRLIPAAVAAFKSRELSDSPLEGG